MPYSSPVKCGFLSESRMPPTPKRTPCKRPSSSDLDCCSPSKCPASPGPSRTGLRSATPKKSKPDEEDHLMIKSPIKFSLPSVTVDLVKLDLSSVMTRTESSVLSQRPPIVIMFEDFESFHSSVLQDYITVCG